MAKATSDILPSHLGLPEKFASYRRGQVEVAMRIADSGKRFSLLDAPTGTGKSLIYMTAAALRGDRALVLVGTKGLQEQVGSEFGATDIRGRGNYICPKFGTCDQPYVMEQVCPNAGAGVCSYSNQVATARNSHSVVSNYAYWMSLARHGDPGALGDFDMLILDEAHTAPDWLTNVCTVTFDRSEVKELLGLALPPVESPIADWAEWAEIASGRAFEAMSRLAKSDVQRRARLSTMRDDLREVAGAGQEGAAQWAVEATSKGAKVCPVWAHPYAEPYLFRSIPKVLLCSATLSPSIRRYLSIPEADSDYFDVASGFEPKRRPFIFIPTTKVDRYMGEGDTRLWVNRMDAIIEGRKDRKGIIHTRSYERARLIVARSRHSDMMITHDGRGLQAAVEEFKTTSRPCVLVSPSVEEGFDFPGDQCRYQIIAKVPFLDSRSPVTKARMDSDKKYSNYITGQTIVQMVGRSTRSADDASETFILDDHWMWFRNAAEFPRWFKIAWRQESKVPAALALG